MFRKYRVVDFDELSDDAFVHLSRFGESVCDDVVNDYLVTSGLETDIANMVRDLIQSHEYYSETEKFVDGDVEFTVRASRDEFGSIETEEDGTTTIRVSVVFGVYYDNIYDGFEDHARYDFRVLIKEV